MSGLLPVSKHTDEGLSVGEIGITASVAAVFCRSDAIDLIARQKLSGLEKIADHQVSLCVDIRADMMRDLTGIVAEADTSIKTCRAEPVRAMIWAGLFGQPETNVVAFVGAFADGLFKG